jgi:hypothetical protein
MTSVGYEQSLLWVRILMAGAIFIPVTFFHFIVLFLEDPKSQSRKIPKWLYLFFSLFLILDFTPLFIGDLKKIGTFDFWPSPGIAFHFFLFFWVLLFCTCFVLLYKKLNSKKIDDRKKRQIASLFWGVVIGLVGGSTNYFLWYDIPILPIGNILVVVFVFFTFYAIAKYRLMDIKLIFRKSTVFLLSITVVILLSVGVKILSEHLLGFSALMSDILMLLTAVAIYDPIKDRCFFLANKYFFSSYYDSRKVIADISDNLRIFLDTEKIYEYIYQKLSAAFRFRSFGVLFYDKTKKKYKLAYNKGFNVGKKKLFDRDPVLQKEFINKDKPIVIEEIKGAYKKGRVKKMLDYLDSLEVKVVAPLNTQDETIGILVFGPKESGDIYNEEDLEVIKIIGNQAAITIENARLYEETRNFNTKLKREVDKATRGLRAANERLRRLDRAKTDFISIASHQLRTPLTIIRGYVSMLLENNFGKLGKKQDEALRKVSASSERLIGLVEDLLNISRIESGRMEYNFKKTDLAKLIQGVYEELKPAAEKRSCGLFLTGPGAACPRSTLTRTRSGRS